MKISNARLLRFVSFDVIHRLFFVIDYSSAIFKYLIAPLYLKFYFIVKKLYQNNIFGVLDREMLYWSNKEKELLSLGNGYNSSIDNLGLLPYHIERLKRMTQEQFEVVIADIDQDGSFLSYFGPVLNARVVNKDNWLKRTKFDLQLVVTNGSVGVKKIFKKNKISFLNEVRALYYLRGCGCNVPAIQAIDFNNISITVSYISGRVLRTELFEKAMVLNDRQSKANAQSFLLTDTATEKMRIEKCKQVLGDVIDKCFIEFLFVELKKLHAAGFIWNDLKYGNVIIEQQSNLPFLIDFEASGHYPTLFKESFCILRDKEIARFNQLFNTDKICNRKRIQNRIDQERNCELYAPVYWGAGLHLGNVSDVETGFGRWQYILKRNIPNFVKKRILDLGANNAFNSIQLLRNGAYEAVAIELQNKFIEQGAFIKDVFEYYDNKVYNLKHVQNNMQNVSEMNLGKFDIVLALCCIYYLDDAAISKLISYISTITDILVLQCNTELSPDRIDAHVYTKASVEYNLMTLVRNGFPHTQVIGFPGYNRPLIIARKT